MNLPRLQFAINCAFADKTQRRLRWHLKNLGLGLGLLASSSLGFAQETVDLPALPFDLVKPPVRVQSLAPPTGKQSSTRLKSVPAKPVTIQIGPTGASVPVDPFAQSGSSQIRQPLVDPTQSMIVDPTQSTIIEPLPSPPSPYDGLRDLPAPQSAPRNLVQPPARVQRSVAPGTTSPGSSLVPPPTSATVPLDVPLNVPVENLAPPPTSQVITPSPDALPNLYEPNQLQSLPPVQPHQVVSPQPTLQEGVYTTDPLIDGGTPMSDPVAVSDPIASSPTCHVPDTSLPRVTPVFSVQANTQSDGQQMLAPYRQRANCLGTNGTHQAVTQQLSMLPAGYLPWWIDGVRNELGFSKEYVPITLDALLQSAICCSPHVQMAATEPHIQHTQVFVEAAQFDWRTFVDTKYDDINDPVGNTLTTGNNDDRFTQGEWFGQAGAKKRNRAGGEFEASQRIGYLNNNSVFLIPPNQGSSRLQLSYRQPIFRGSGKSYNESLIFLAKIDYTTSADQFLGNLQSHLSSVTEAYWELVRTRAEFLQKKKLLDSATVIVEQLEGRAEVDASSRQILRARAAVEKRRAEIARTITSIRNAESQLRLLVNAPDLVAAAGAEFTPMDIPVSDYVPVELADALSTALTNRQDISSAIRNLRASNVKLGVAKNELLPRLDMVIGTYVAGLDGNSDVFNSWVNQFRDGRPGFNVGFEFELPQGNRAAKAREMRRRWELNKSLHEFRSIVETAMTEVEVAVREIETTHQELRGRFQAMNAAREETEYLRDRWQTLPGLDDSVTLLLEDLLASQERLAAEEAAYSQAQVNYALAFVDLQERMGTLFQVD